MQMYRTPRKNAAVITMISSSLQFTKPMKDEMSMNRKLLVNFYGEEGNTKCKREECFEKLTPLEFWSGA